MNAAVVDASIAIKWVIPERDSAAAIGVKGLDLRAPTIFLEECASVLCRKVNASEISLRHAEERLNEIRHAPVRIIPDGEHLIDAVRLANRLQHAVDDCIYLAVARRENIPFITADKKFLAVAGTDQELAGRIRLHSASEASLE